MELISPRHADPSKVTIWMPAGSSSSPARLQEALPKDSIKQETTESAGKKTSDYEEWEYPTESDAPLNEVRVEDNGRLDGNGPSNGTLRGSGLVQEKKFLHFAPTKAFIGDSFAVPGERSPAPPLPSPSPARF